MHIQTIIEQLYQLKLAAMAKELQQQDLKPGSSSLSFENRLGLLVSSEILFRENRRYLNLLRIAKLKQPMASIEDIDYRSNRNLNKSEFQNLTNLDFIKHRHNVLITGPTGSGKSYLACALGQASCRNGLSVRYLRLPRFIEELTVAHADGSYSRLLEQLLKTDLLILDDFSLTPLLQSQIHDLFNIIEDRHGVKSTLITGQLPIKHWHEYLGEPTIADAILDRLLQHSHIIELTGGSMRQVKKGLKNEPVDKPVHDVANSTGTGNMANTVKGDTNITGQV
jgi:DNA replication protein DnaC